MKKKIAVYPGSFDPITNGHLNILKRALKIYDEVIILIANNPNKKGLLSIKDRIELVKSSSKIFKNVKVDYTDGLSIEYAKKVGAISIIRGLRPVLDFEYECALNASNQFIDKNIDMVYFMASKDTAFISSSSIVELLKNGVDITPLVPNCVYKKLKKIKF